MFLIPRATGGNGTKAFGVSSIGRRVDNDTIQEQSEIARKYSPIRKKLESIYRDTDADIKYIKRRGKEITELYPQKTNTEIEIMNTVSSLQSVKLQTVKAMMATVKDEIQLENSRMEMFHKMSGGKMLGNTGSENMQSAAVIARGAAGQVRPGEVGSILPTYAENNTYINRNNQAEEYEDTSYFAVDSEESNIPQEVKVGGDTQPPSTGVTEQVFATNKEVEIVEEENDYNPNFAPAESVQRYEGADGHIVTPKTDSKFVSILDDNVGVGESAKYLVGDDTRQEFDELNQKMSYATAATCLNNKMNIEGIVKKMHYDSERRVGWLRTYDSNGDLVPSESLTPLSIIGDIEVSEAGGTTYATDRFNNTYNVIDDKMENMPEVLVEELKDSIRNS